MHNSTMFALPFFAVIFLVILQVSSGQFPSPLTANFEKEKDLSFGGPATRPYSGPGDNLLPQNVPRGVVTPQNDQSGRSIFSNEPSVTLFTDTFLDAVATMGNLRELLDLSQTTPKQYGDFLRWYCEVVLRKIGVDDENAAAISEFTSRAIAPNFDILTLPVVARSVSNSAVNFLYVNGVLGLHNAKDLSLAFAKALTDSAMITMNFNPVSKFPALTNGYLNFFDSLGLVTKTKAPLLGYYIGNEWFLAALNYKYL